MHELVINGTSYPLNFGMGFLRRINKQAAAPIADFPGKSIDLGFRYWYSRLTAMEDIFALENILLEGNHGLNPRMTQTILDEWFDDDDTDIDAVFQEVKDFLKQTNVLKKLIRMIEKDVRANQNPETADPETT